MSTRTETDTFGAIEVEANSGSGIPGFQHLRYDGFETDLHTTPDRFGAFLYFSALFSKEFPGC
jgi:hypothetical protein